MLFSGVIVEQNEDFERGRQKHNLHKGLPCRFTESIDAELVLPAWFVPAMMVSCGGFGLLLTTGKMLLIEKINAVSVDINQEILLDVRLVTNNPKILVKEENIKRFCGHFNISNSVIFTTDNSCNIATIKTSCIVGAFDIHGS